MELFDLPPQRLDDASHLAVFGDLPATLADDLRDAVVGDLVLQLLDKGWRQGQLAARVGAMPSGRDPVADVEALLRGFLEQVPPDARWRQEKIERDRTASDASFEQPASDENRQRWIQQIRAEIGSPRPPARKETRRSRPACALCNAESSYFVTREVRLCDGCVALLGSGTATLSEAG
jgi:hypothetical protein